MNNHKRLVLNLYRSKLKICYEYGYSLGNHKYDIKQNFNLGKAILRCKQIENDENKITYIANHIRQSYKDQKYLKDNYLISFYIDEGFRVLRKIDDLLFYNDDDNEDDLLFYNDDYDDFDDFDDYLK